MAGKGGYQRPAHPAPVSGPGRLAQRTDGGPGDKQALSAPSGMPYGARQAMIAAEQAAPMASADLPPSAPSPVPGPVPTAPAANQFGGVGFDAPSTMPHLPVTDGAAAGAGAGPDALSFAGTDVVDQQAGAMTNMLRGIAPTNATGVLAQLLQTAEARGL